MKKEQLTAAVFMGVVVIASMFVYDRYVVPWLTRAGLGG